MILYLILLVMHGLDLVFAFGPLVLLSLYWKGLSRTGAISGMISGSVVVIIWIVFVKPLGEYNDFFNLYEIIPGFLTSLIVTYIVSLITKNRIEMLKKN